MNLRVHRIVDASPRRVEIAQAAWRIIRRDGLDHASVRNVAAEAGLVAGSVRHYFPSQAELHEFAMRLVTDRIRTRITTLDPPADPVARAEWTLEEFLPLDAERRAEAEVWLAFTGQALVDVRLRGARSDGDELLETVCRHAVRDLRQLTGALNVEPEALRLAAFVRGLAVTYLLQTGHQAATGVRELLSMHVDSLLATSPPPPLDHVGLTGHDPTEPT